MFYNSLAQSREQVVKIYVSCADVVVKNTEGSVVLSQVEPFWDGADKISKSKYKVNKLIIGEKLKKFFQSK
jgi:hypothetical protein